MLPLSNHHSHIPSETPYALSFIHISHGIKQISDVTKIENRDRGRERERERAEKERGREGKRKREKKVHHIRIPVVKKTPLIYLKD